MKMNKKGFTLIEMLVVIAIIAVLVSIVIPTVSSATEKAKEAADAANIRAAIAEVTTNALANGSAADVEVEMKQATAGFVSSDLKSIGGLADDQYAEVAKATSGTKVVISWNSTLNAVNVKVGDKSVPATTAPAAE